MFFDHLDAKFENSLTGTLDAILHGQTVITSNQQEILNKMSTISTQLTQVQSDLTEVQTDVANLAAGVTQLDTTITTLNTTIANTGDVLSPATQAVLTSLAAQSAGLKVAADAASAELPTGTSPTPAA